MDQPHVFTSILGTLPWLGRGLAVSLIAWGMTLGAWLATGLVIALLGVTRRRRGWLGKTLAAWLVAAILTLGAAETLWRIDQIGARSRAGDLGLQDQLAVAGFNIAFGTSALVMGFPEFGIETLSLGLPYAPAGDCPDARLRTYRQGAQRMPPDVAPPLRRWYSDFPMRSARFRSVAKQWARSLPAEAADGATRRLGPKRGFTWPATDYFSATEANGVPVALNAPTTTMEGIATRDGDRWRMDLVVHLAVTYPERATLKIGPFSLEEGMWHDARHLLVPYCGEYAWSTWADDPALDIEGPQRTAGERLMTWVLRAMGAGY